MAGGTSNTEMNKTLNKILDVLRSDADHRHSLSLSSRGSRTVVDIQPIVQALNGIALDSTLSTISGKVATEFTLGAILTKLSSDPPTQTTLAAILTQNTAIETSVDALTLSNTTDLNDILAKILTSPATEALQNTLISRIQDVDDNTRHLGKGVAEYAEEIEDSVIDVKNAVQDVVDNTQFGIFPFTKGVAEFAEEIEDSVNALIISNVADTVLVLFSLASIDAELVTANLKLININTNLTGLNLREQFQGGGINGITGTGSDLFYEARPSTASTQIDCQFLTFKNTFFAPTTITLYLTDGNTVHDIQLDQVAGLGGGLTHVFTINRRLQRSLWLLIVTQFASTHVFTAAFTGKGDGDLVLTAT